MRPRVYNIHFWFLLSFGILAIADHAFASRSVANYWQKTREADLVAQVKVEAVGREVRLSVLELLKGTTNSTVLCVPLPEEKPGEYRKRNFISFPARRWQVEEQWIVFLLSDKPAAEWKLLYAAKHAPDEKYSPLQTVRDVLQFDSLQDAREKCIFLVKLASSGQGYSAQAARHELEHFNLPEFLECLQPLAQNPDTRQVWINLLCCNSNPQATQILRSLLKSEEGRNLYYVLDALGRKRDTPAEETEAISQELLPFLEHPEAHARGAAVFILHYRDYLAAFPRIAQRLHDPDPQVRSSALCWPWYAWREMPAEIKQTMRRLLHDPDRNVRESACHALISIRDVSSLYRLMWRHFADAEELVRHAFDLGLLLQDKPVQVVLMLCWPLFVACWAGSWLLSPVRRQRRAAVLACGALAGLAIGAAAGAMIGWCHTGTPLPDILLLTPFLFLPAGIIISAAVVRRRNKKPVAPTEPTFR